jgi:hypothetical protein
MRRPLASILVVFALGGSARAQDAGDITGVWQKNKELSQDVAAKIKEAAGPGHVVGGPGWTAGTETWLPWGGATRFDEGQRVELRDLLLASVPGLESIEIVQEGQEVKTIHGEDGVRLFNLARASAGTGGLSGAILTRTASWKDGQLVLESKGKEGRFTEIFTPVPARRQLTYALRLERKLLKAPLEATLVYDRAPAR